MEIREDLQAVSTSISRLLSIAHEFSENDNYWSHLKNREDFDNIFRIADRDRYKVEKVYCDGRDMARFMKDTLSAINYNFSQFPTLTSIVDGFDNTWVYENYDPDVPDVAKLICEKNDAQIWSVNQIITCRTAAQGGHIEFCDTCDNQMILYNSCRNRHCPKCQTITKERWLDQRKSELLPVVYFHLVFTMPHELNPIILC